MNATGKVVIFAGGAACLGFFLWFRASHSAAHLAHPALMPLSSPESAAPAKQAATRPVANGTRFASSPERDPIEICGIGKVRLPADDADGQEYVAALAERAGKRWIAALTSSSDPRARAVGLMLVYPKQSEALAQLALQNDDPALYEMALSACAVSEHAGAACAQTSAQAWAQSDADNAVPWFEVAQHARRAGDFAGERAAMQRAAAAHRIENYNLSLLTYSAASLPANLSPVERHELQIQAIGVAAAMGPPSYVEASKYCSKDAVSDALVAEECRAVADLFAQGNSVMDLAFAKSIGARAGWSKERVDAAAIYVQALQAEGERMEPAGGAARFSCGAVLASNAFFDELSRKGEVGAMRERLEQSGESPGERAQEHRQYVEQLMSRAASESVAKEQTPTTPQ